jgi:hypothetical protein
MTEKKKLRPETSNKNGIEEGKAIKKKEERINPQEKRARREGEDRSRVRRVELLELASCGGERYLTSPPDPVPATRIKQEAYLVR